jgi:hypothetical protein
MKFVRFAFMQGFLLIFAVVSVSTGSAAEARPWLCRNKPVFSSDSAMKYNISSSGGSRWDLLLMQFAPGSAHDGFEIVASHELARDKTAVGTLAPGRYFAVAMYRGGGGRWICSEYADDRGRPAGAVSRICYGEDSTGCAVALTVFPASPPNGTAH